MKQTIVLKLTCLLCLVFGLASCGIDIPKETKSSYKTMTVKKTDITMPLKFSAKMKGQSDVTISPQVSGQLMKICVTEGQQVHRGQTLFVIDSRNARHEVEAAQANLQNWPIGRVLMSYFASKYVRFVTGFKVHDTTAGFKCYRRRVLATIELDKIRFKGYGFQIEMKYTAYKIGFKIKEVPVIFINRREGVSKMSGGIFGEAFFGVMRLRLDGWFRKYPPLPKS